MKIIKIGAIWCSGCLMVTPKFEEVSKLYPNIEFISYDVDIDDVSKYEIGNRIPVIIFEKEGLEVERLIGEVSKDQIIELIERGQK